MGEEEDLPWLVIARREEGVLENTSNTEHNPRIIEYHSTTGKFQNDETPWCSSFVNWVITQAGLKGTNSVLGLLLGSIGDKNSINQHMDV